MIAWLPEWTPLLGTKSDAALARLLGIPQFMVLRRRRSLGIAPHTPFRKNCWRREWDALLGTMPDGRLAKQIGVRAETVLVHRRAAGIGAFHGKQKLLCTSCGKTVSRAKARSVVTCRQCELLKSREYYRRWYQEHKATHDTGRWNREHPEQRRAYLAKYHQENKSRLLRYHRRYYRERVKKDRELLASLPCLDCGMKHTDERREAILRRMLPCSTMEIHEAWPCIWGEGGKANKNNAGSQRLFCDLKRVGAVLWKGSYSIQHRGVA